MMEITRETLLTVSGIAFVTAIALQLWIKPWLTKRYKEKWWHDIALNGAATALSILLAFAGLYIGLVKKMGRALHSPQYKASSRHSRRCTGTRR